MACKRNVYNILHCKYFLTTKHSTNLLKSLQLSIINNNNSMGILFNDRVLIDSIFNLC
jgi:hypothetical protein